MKRIEDRFGERYDFGIASFSIDPKDTPSVLKAYADSYNVFSQNWHFLTGEKERIYNLANEGFNIFASVNSRVAGGFEHQGYFALIDKNGFIRCRSDQFGNPIVYYMGIDEENVEVQDKSIINSLKCKNAIKKAISLIKGKGRMLVRKSGTEPVVRIMCETDDKTMLSKCVNIVKKSII